MVRVHPGLLRDLSVQRRRATGVSLRVLRSCRRHKPATPVFVGELAVPATLSRWRSWVRIPSETLRRGELFRGTVRKSAKRRSSNLRGLWVRLPLVPLRENKYASAGHWRAPVVVTHPPDGIAGSTPARRTHQFEMRRTVRPVRLLAQDGGPSSRKGGFDSRTGRSREKNRQQKGGSTRQLTLAARRAEEVDRRTDQVVELADTRHSECRAPAAWEFDSPLGHLNQRIVNSRGVNSRSVKSRMTQGGQCPVEPHKLHRPGATPGPATDRTKHADWCKDGRVRKPAKRRCRERRDFVGSTPTSVTD